jgi:hypothetical protein
MFIQNLAVDLQNIIILDLVMVIGLLVALGVRTVGLRVIVLVLNHVDRGPVVIHQIVKVALPTGGIRTNPVMSMTATAQDLGEITPLKILQIGQSCDALDPPRRPDMKTHRTFLSP